MFPYIAASARRWWSARPRFFIRRLNAAQQFMLHRTIESRILQKFVAKASARELKFRGGWVAARCGRRLSKGENDMTSASYQIPTEVREFAEKSVEQARKAFEGFSGAAQKAIAAVDTTAIPAAAGAKVVGSAALGYAEANIKAAFDLATKLVQAKDVQEVLTLQTEFAKSQFAAFQEQTQELGATLTEQTKELGAAFTKAASSK